MTKEEYAALKVGDILAVKPGAGVREWRAKQRREGVRVSFQDPVRIVVAIERSKYSGSVQRACMWRLGSSAPEERFPSERHRVWVGKSTLKARYTPHTGPVYTGTQEVKKVTERYLPRAFADTKYYPENDRYEILELVW